MQTDLNQYNDRSHCLKRLQGLLSFASDLTSSRMTSQARCLQIGDSLYFLPVADSATATLPFSIRPADLVCEESPLPFSAAFESVISPLSLHSTKSPREHLTQLISILKPGGCLTLTTLGHYSLQEWRTLLVTEELSLPEFIHPALLKSWLPAQGERTLQEDWLILSYDSILDFFQELKSLGITYATPHTLSLQKFRKLIHQFNSEIPRKLSFQLITLTYQKPQFLRDE